MKRNQILALGKLVLAGMDPKRSRAVVDVVSADVAGTETDSYTVSVRLVKAAGLVLSASQRILLNRWLENAVAKDNLKAEANQLAGGRKRLATQALAAAKNRVFAEAEARASNGDFSLVEAEGGRMEVFRDGLLDFLALAMAPMPMPALERVAQQRETLTACIRRITGNQLSVEDSEDILQTCLLRMIPVLRHLASNGRPDILEDDAQVEAYARIAMRNAAIDECRRRGRFVCLEGCDLSDTMRPDEKILLSELLQCPALSSGGRKVLELAIEQGMTTREIAENLGLQKNVVYQRWHTAIKRLRLAV